MEFFFDEDRKIKIDRQMFETLKLAVDLKSLEKLAHQSYRSVGPVSKTAYEAATVWLDEEIFGTKRIVFFSKRIQHAYEDFCGHCEGLAYETTKHYSTDANSDLVINYLGMSGGQKSELRTKMDDLASKAFSSAENLWAVTEEILAISY